MSDAGDTVASARTKWPLVSPVESISRTMNSVSWPTSARGAKGECQNWLDDISATCSVLGSRRLTDVPIL